MSGLSRLNPRYLFPAMILILPHMLLHSASETGTAEPMKSSLKLPHLTHFQGIL